MSSYVYILNLQVLSLLYVRKENSLIPDCARTSAQDLKGIFLRWNVKNQNIKTVESRIIVFWLIVKGKVQGLYIVQNFPANTMNRVLATPDTIKFVSPCLESLKQYDSKGILSLRKIGFPPRYISVGDRVSIPSPLIPNDLYQLGCCYRADLVSAMGAF